MATARKLKAAAIAGYLANPNRCRQCDEPIALRPGKSEVSVARAKKFCSQRCLAIASNARAPKRVAKPRYCLSCGVDVKPKANHVVPVRCPPCTAARAKPPATRGRVSHAYIRQHARKVLTAQGLPEVCGDCGYARFVETCHRIPVKFFSAEATLAEINAPSNLMWLCPNCHWEHDHPEVMVKAKFRESV